MSPSRLFHRIFRGLFLLPPFLLVLSGQVFALDKQREPSQYAIQLWLTENGLPQNSVHAISQTTDGYIWIATEEGLARFDGIGFTVFDKENTPTLRTNDIRCLLGDARGSLWIGTADGLVRLFAGKFTAFTTREGLPSDLIETLYADHEDNVWIATPAGLTRYKDGAFSRFEPQQQWSHGKVEALFEDRDNGLWIASPSGLSRYQQGKLIDYDKQNAFNTTNVVAITEDKEGRLWFGTNDGLTCLSQGRFQTFTTRDGLANNRVTSLLADREGALWIGTAGGLSRFANDHFSGFKQGHALSANIILSIWEDREGSLWVGTESGGLNLLKDKKFTTYTTEDGLASNLVKAIYEARNGDIWIGTNGGGLSRLRAGKFTSFTTKDGLSSNVVLALFGDSQGNIWIGTPDGLNRFKDNHFTVFTSADGLASDFVRSIYVDHEGSVWVGTRGGLTRLKDGVFKIYTTIDGLPNEFVGTIYEAAGGNLWIGTLGGLTRLKDEKFTTFTTKEGLSSDVVISLYEDSERTLWIGTSGGGLNRFRDGKFTSFTATEGLLDDVVYRVLGDQQNNLWLSSNKGIFRVGRQELDDLADHKSNSLRPTVYGTADGMITRECSGGGHPAGWKGSDGKLWFPTIKGVVMIDPQNIRINENLPPVIINQIRIDDESIIPGPGVELAPGKSRFDFYYTALSFIAPEKVRFKYKLEGFDRDWVDSGTRRIAYYTNLPPGKYRFRVIASNNDGIWNEAGAAFDLRLRPHFYQTSWFYALCLLTLVLLVWQGYRLRVRQMEGQFAAVLAERNRIAREIHDNLAQELLGISVQLEVVARTMPPAAELAKSHLDRVRMLVRHGVAEARRYVWDLRSQALDHKDLPTALTETARRLTTGTATQAQVEVSGIFRPLKPSVENNLLRIGQEAINNAVRHGQAQRILINLLFDSKRVQLRIRDDGCGFDQQISNNGDSNHFGLLGMRERAEEIGGTLSINSIVQKGTEVTVSVPIG